MEYLYRNPKKPVSKSFEILSAIQGFLAFVPKYEIKIEKTKKKPKNDMKCHYLKKYQDISINLSQHQGQQNKS